MKLRQVKLLLALALLFNTSLYGKDVTKNVQSTSKSITHKLWDELLTIHVSDKGIVNYKGFIKDKVKLDKYLKLLSSAHPNTSWSRNERKAYWINAYNAFTIKLVITKYPLKSIKDIGGSFVSPWDIKFIEIEGHKYTLGNIEHNILRKKFNDPRIHFAINCASYSCPKLLNTAYTASQLDSQLEKMAKDFINDPAKNKITSTSVQLSELFKWFKDDFTKQVTIIDFINKYSDVKVNANAKISYATYNWNLNE